MKKSTVKKLTTGDILCIPIPDFGFGYAKYIKTKDIIENPSYPGILRIYLTISLEKITDFLKIDKELLLAPLSIIGTSGIHKKNWEVIANEPISESEKQLPDVKRGHPPFLYGYDELKYDKWIYLKRLGNDSETGFSDYDKVKHLSWAGGINIEGIPFLIQLEQYKAKGENLEWKKFDWLEEEIYKRYASLPVYSKLDKKTRDFALK